MALAAIVQETDEQRMEFEELAPPGSQQTIIREENKVCQLLANHTGIFGRTKHIDVGYHFVRERIQHRKVRVD